MLFRSDAATPKRYFKFSRKCEGGASREKTINLNAMKQKERKTPLRLKSGSSEASVKKEGEGWGVGGALNIYWLTSFNSSYN